MKNHQISATLHWTVAYYFSLGAQPSSMVHQETRKKSYLNVYIAVKVFKSSLEQHTGANYREVLLERRVAGLREQNLLTGGSLLAGRWLCLSLTK